ncbi:hypothetical protein Kpol_1043p2 [Vanderwaltozyma polyspora DSM 70294]|uniref:Macro domain-containing protein n=1 Tax=Vanderwaltozyma polyspora (strain ATCC 22028 / DSM 70294 / BCRC 21397 / CBS 2163 / NBRC 10782 / NRRL Y-8283 / UCD 57-17) TaxID=436907 RepID=A7TIM0_VANPO|nr:uncharacterized protein Kpol_1043p2 [Vanderwaltozyma polyspora DSM 70294]EDO17812.1 hypothetical protein Kpol_1043p2 [Vanderwaltozyma polyspora DSM 70294]
MRIVLCDTNKTVCSLWRKMLPKSLLDKGKVEVHNTTFEALAHKLYKTNVNQLSKEGTRPYCSPEKCVVVSPGNSFGYLGGGFDLALCEYYGGKPFETWFRSKLNNEYYPIGSSTLIDAYDYFLPESSDKIRHILHVPTIVAPSHSSFMKAEPLRSGYEPVFNATWNSLRSFPSCCDTIIMSGLYTGYAGVPAEVSCKSMSFAITLYHLCEILPKDVVNLLTMYYLGYPFEDFFLHTASEQLELLGIDKEQLIAFDVTRDFIDAIIPSHLLDSL